MKELFCALSILLVTISGRVALSFNIREALQDVFFSSAKILAYDQNDLDSESEFASRNLKRSDFQPSEFDREITPYGSDVDHSSDDSGEVRRDVERKRVNQVVAINVFFLVLILSIFYFKRRARRGRS